MPTHPICWAAFPESPFKAPRLVLGGSFMQNRHKIESTKLKANSAVLPYCYPLLHLLFWLSCSSLGSLLRLAIMNVLARHGNTVQHSSALTISWKRLGTPWRSSINSATEGCPWRAPTFHTDSPYRDPMCVPPLSWMGLLNDLVLQDRKWTICYLPAPGGCLKQLCSWLKKKKKNTPAVVWRALWPVPLDHEMPGTKHRFMRK